MVGRRYQRNPRSRSSTMRPLKVGVQLPEVEYDYTWPQLAEMAGVAEEIGLALLSPEPGQKGCPPLMVGTTGPRMLAITLPRVEMWNAWHADYGNNQDGLAKLLATIDRACEQHHRDPATLLRSVCPLVRMSGGTGRQTAYGTTGLPLDGTTPTALAEELAAYAELGVAHVQLV